MRDHASLVLGADTTARATLHRTQVSRMATHWIAYQQSGLFVSRTMRRLNVVKSQHPSLSRLTAFSRVVRRRPTPEAALG
jgi:hypothetical protein